MYKDDDDGNCIGKQSTWVISNSNEMRANETHFIRQVQQLTLINGYVCITAFFSSCFAAVASSAILYSS